MHCSNCGFKILDPTGPCFTCISRTTDEFEDEEALRRLERIIADLQKVGV